MMETLVQEKKPSLIEDAIASSWSKIAPFWPLRNLIAVNPIAGFEDLPFEKALSQAETYFQQKELPKEMESINRETIKWLQCFFDEGQATIEMPHRDRGLLKSTLSLMRFDPRLKEGKVLIENWLSQKPEIVILDALRYLRVEKQERELFMTLLLTTLPGWAGFIQYRTSWADAQDADHPYFVTQSEYLALRLVLTCILWKKGRELLKWHLKARAMASIGEKLAEMKSFEESYRKEILSKLHHPQTKSQARPQAQLVFCIDVRSEPFRRAIETQGAYETFGFAGFFGLPISIENAITGESHASCPVLLKPSHNILEKPTCSHSHHKKRYKRLKQIKKIYQSLKYTFTTPFSLVEALGFSSGVWMGVKSLFPKTSAHLKRSLNSLVASEYALTPDLSSLSLMQKVEFASGALNGMGLTENFAPLVVFCGHGSTTENNAYASALDCGACGGRHGAPNARILAAILNAPEVRNELEKQGISIPDDTEFLAGLHNTTTDELKLFGGGVSTHELIRDLEAARRQNCQFRAQKMALGRDADVDSIESRSQDWAQPRPEWGLAKNAAFIVAPRSLTQHVDLDGRSFLHSYNWRSDGDGAILTSILTAPMVVAQWINSQYLFSTLDNIAFGSGSKVTKNITGKIGIMQGNASDLMHGLPMQSVYQSDDEPYHRPQRLTVIVHAPKKRLSQIIEEQPILQKLFGNGWVHLVCHDPQEEKSFNLQRDFTWS
ncbi:MAG: DUF2309 domain-containing protein [Simkaniaceae bacterium]|nr:DUF2309 domain-containing protein [Simkaniaceae bacterium]